MGVTRVTISAIYRNLLLLLYGGVATAVLVAWYRPLLGSSFFNRLEAWGSRFGARKLASIAAVALLVIVLRLSFLPFLGTPIPEVPDEFCNLLAADTFVHGRLTNPPHPMSLYLEGFHEIQRPSYMSMFPPAQGGFLAIGQAVGVPWLGVLFSVACLCAAITWALQAWVPARWAFVGGIIAVAQFGATNYWIESYFGGAAAGIGGALVIGAFPRILNYQRVRDAVILALGVGILANSRPYEGAVFCAAVLIAGLWFHRKRKLDWAVTLRRVLLPVAVLLVVIGAFMAYYDWRITGSALWLPWVFALRNFSSPILFGRLGPAFHYPNPQFASYYEHLREGRLLATTWTGFAHVAWHKITDLASFFAPPQLGFPILVALLATARNWKIRLSVVLCAVATIATFAIEPSKPHYLAPATAVIYVLIIFGLRYTRKWNFHGRPVGVGLVRALILIHLALLPAQAVALSIVHHLGISQPRAVALARAEIENRLEKLPGEHLVIVRYSSDYDLSFGDWVYNRADIDHAKVVWAREIPGVDMRPLIDYFKDRVVWLAEPTAKPPKLSPYSQNEHN